MNATHCWPFAREYSIWNATVAAIQFWMADLKPHILNNAIERVYTAFFCHDSAQQLRNISDEILFSHLVTTLHDAFEQEHAQKGEGYESRSESLSVPTLTEEHHGYTMFPMLKIYLLTLPTAQQHPEYSPTRFRSHRPVCCC